RSPAHARDQGEVRAAGRDARWQHLCRISCADQGRVRKDEDDRKEERHHAERVAIAPEAPPLAPRRGRSIALLRKRKPPSLRSRNQQRSDRVIVRNAIASHGISASSNSLTSRLSGPGPKSRSQSSAWNIM